MSAIRADQVPLAARVLANAFANAPRYTFLLPNDAQRHATLPWLWGAVIRASLLSGAVVHVAHEEPGSPPLGVAVWSPPGRHKHSALTLVRSGLWAAPFRLGIAAYWRRRSLGPLLAALGPPEPHWYLNVIGVDPTQQRTGAGTALLRRMLPRIDGDGLAAFLDTSEPNNLGYYERFGFQVTVELKLPNGIPLWGLTRQPRTGQA